MLKAVVFLSVIGLIIWLYQKSRKNSADNSSTPTQIPTAQKMVACHYCHLNIPESEAVQTNGRHFCSDEHRRLGS